MFLKMKTHIFAPATLGLLLILLVPSAVQADDLLTGFSGNSRLSEAIWRLGAFVPSGPSESISRSTTIDGVKGLPPVTITMVFDEPLNPWPGSLKLTFMAESSSPPAYITISDSRPFGGPNLRFSRSTAGGTEVKKVEASEKDYLDILDRLNERLLSSRSRLSAIKWQENESGFEVARSRLLYGARLGSADLFLARFSPDKFVFRPYHETELPNPEAVNISGWSRHLESATALINGGQYYPDRSYMGYLSRDGEALSTGRHEQWKGFLVGGLKEGAPDGSPGASVMDMQHYEGAWRPEHYHNVMQSFMLLDQHGRIRVRDSRNLASRSAIGEDKEGRIVLIMTPAAVTLYDLAMALRDSRLGLKRVMGLDGGFEAQLLVRRNGTPFMSGGHFSSARSRAVYMPGYHRSLPTVLAVEPLIPMEAVPSGEPPVPSAEPEGAGNDNGRSAGPHENRSGLNSPDLP